MELLIGHQGRYGKNFEEHQHEAFESCIILETPSFVSELLGCRGQAMLIK